MEIIFSQKWRFSLYKIIINYLLSPIFYAIITVYTKTHKS